MPKYRYMPAEEDLPALVFQEEAVALEYLVQQNCLRVPEHCDHCGRKMKLKQRSKSLTMYKCCACGRGQSMLKNTFFGNSKLPAHKILSICYKLLCRGQHQTIVAETKRTPETVTNWTGLLHELVATDLEAIDAEGPQLGGPDKIVEVDESKFGKMKPPWFGHHVEGVWLVGTKERGGQFRVTRVDDRSAPSLNFVIEQWVQPGSWVYTDCWKGYRDADLLAMGMDRHGTVNHSKYFKDPDTQVHTNSIEGMWSALKRRIPPRARTAADIDGYLSMFMWERMHRTGHHSVWERFLFCLRHVVYDANGKPVFKEPVVQADWDNEL